jgi:peptidoglycan/LPS O-acetylase OafA/YrhL
MAAKQGYIGAIDGLRCFAMTSVVAEHSKLLPIGWSGVWLFFVISGFVVTKTLCERKPVDKRPARIFGNFMARRVLRIWPIYFMYLLIGIALTVLIGEEVDWYAIGAMSTFSYNFYLIEYGRIFGIWPTGHLWTISVEEQFYVIFGLLFAYLSRQSLVKVLWFMALMGLPVRFIASAFYQVHLPDDNDRGYAVYANSFCQFDAFCIGSLIALNADVISVSRSKVNALLMAGVGAVVTYCVVYFGVNKFVLGNAGADVFKHVVTGVLFGQWREVFLYSAINILSAALICLILVDNRILVAISGGSITRWIGKISYGAYVYHVAAAVAVHNIVVDYLGVASDTFVSYATQFALTYVLCVTVAELSFRYFESRFLQYRRLF